VRGGALAVLLLAGILLPGISAAAAPKDYAYLFLQGKVIGEDGRRPLAGLTIRLSQGSRKFEATTDGRGVFVFDRLPVATYDLEVLAADGRVVRAMRRIEDPQRIRLRLDMGRGPGQALKVEGGDGRLDIDVPRPPAEWKKFWGEFVIVVGTAGLFAL
jgi:hypothetical protein